MVLVVTRTVMARAAVNTYTLWTCNALVRALTLQLIVQIATNKDDRLVAESKIGIVHQSVLKETCIEDDHCVTSIATTQPISSTARSLTIAT